MFEEEILLLKNNVDKEIIDEMFNDVKTLINESLIKENVKLEIIQKIKCMLEWKENMAEVKFREAEILNKQLVKSLNKEIWKLKLTEVKVVLD